MTFIYFSAKINEIIRQAEFICLISELYEHAFHHLLVLKDIYEHQETIKFVLVLNV